MAANTAPADDDVFDTPEPYGPNDPYQVASSLGVAAPKPANSNATTLATSSQPPSVNASDGTNRMIPWERARLMIERGEGTTGDQNIWNYKHASRPDYFTAGGPYQIVDSTWRQGAAWAGIDVSQWQHAIDAPKEVQDRVAHAIYDHLGFQPWTKQAGGSLNSDGTPASNAHTLGTGPGYEEYMRRGLAMFPQTYDPASMITEYRRINQEQMDAERPLIEARLKRQQQEEAEADQRYSDVQRAHDLNDPALQPWTQKPPQADPLGGLASLGSVFAALASGFSHTPAIAAMNGMAAAIDARNEGNQKQYDDAFKAYQYNAQLALDRNAIVQHAYDAAWARVKENPELGLAELRSVAQIYGDEKSELLFESGQLEKADEINRGRIEAASKWAIEQQKLDNINMFGPPAGSEDAKEVEARTRELMAQNPEMSLYAARAQANDELKRKNAELARTKTAAGQERSDIIADLQAKNPQMTKGELDLAADRMIAEAKHLGSNSPQTMAMLAAKQKHIADGDDENTATLKAYNDIKAAGTFTLDTASVDVFAKIFLDTGTMPPLGFGSPQLRGQILQSAARQAQEAGYSAEDVTAIRSGVKADQAALTMLTKSKEQIGSFEGTTLKEMDLAREYMARGAARGQSPILNRWIQYGRQNVEGDADVTQFNTAITSFKNEYTRIMSTPGGSGNVATTDAARAEGERLINTSQTPEQLLANMETMRRGMINRITSINEALAETAGRLRNPGGILKPAEAPAPAAGPRKQPDYVYRNGELVPVTQP